METDGPCCALFALYNFLRQSAIQLKH